MPAAKCNRALVTIPVTINDAPRDCLIAGADAPDADFIFDARVVSVFPDMLHRSVPCWSELVRLIGLTAAHLTAADRSQSARRDRVTRIYDLGCSLGATSASILARMPDTAVHILAVDNAPAMIDGLRTRLQQAVADGRVEPVCADLLDVQVTAARVVVLNLTLQFVQPEHRLALLRRIRQGLVPSGVLILAEKVVWSEPGSDALMSALHADFKRAQGYSELEISRKRAALERVLIPDAIEIHEERLRAAGFTRIERFFQCLNFTGWLAWA